MDRSSDRIRFGGDAGIRPVLQMTPEAIQTLLRSHQDGIFTVCLHVLRHPQDAEDAAQEALLKVAKDAASLREPKAFKTWLYRVVFRTAVDHLRSRATRRRVEEGSAPMQPSLTDEQREAIHEAMSALPDDDRLILVEHYFEKTTIDELGRREGISDVAMGKRLEKAREKLKRGLAGAGILLGSTQLANALEGVTPAVAPAGMLGTAALVAAGGIAVGTKSVASVGVIVGSILLLALVSGSLWWIVGAPVGKRDSHGDRPPEENPISSTPTTKPSTTPSTGPSVVIDFRTGNAVACRRVLASVLPYVRTTDILRWADSLEQLHGGSNLKFEAFAREFVAFAGPDLVSIVKTMLAETEADTAKFLLGAILGRARDPAGMEVLKGLIQGSHYSVAQSALYSIGLIRTPDGFSFLKSTWDQVKTTKSPVVATTLKAIGLFGGESIPLLLEAANSNPGVFRDKAAYLFLVKGKDAVEGLQLLIDTEADGTVRKGAASALAFNLESDHAEAVVELFRKYSEPEVRAGLMYGLMIAWKPPFHEGSRTPARTAIADGILNQAEFPSGNLDVDRALIWLGIVSSPEKATALLDRFGSLNKDSLGPNYTRLLREILGAYSGIPGFDGRLSSLMDSAGITPEERERMRYGGGLRASPETAAALIKSNLETLRGSPPGDPRVNRAVDGLVRSGIEETTLSSALRDAYGRCPTPEERIRLLDSLNVALYSSKESVIPRTFLEAVLRDSEEVDARVLAAYDYLSAGSTGPLKPEALNRIAELIGPEMKWAGESTLNKGEFRMIQVAPSLIGDYYSQFGRSSDIAWLKQLPETFPYPSLLVAKSRELLKRDLEVECRRAIDAIRLKRS